MRYGCFVPPLFVVALAACSPVHKSATGFRLPDGDIERGKIAFVALQCNACHHVAGVEFAAPLASPPTGVVLGGRTTIQPTDGELVTAIINPSHSISHRLGNVTSQGVSRMGDFNESMTVQQLIDLVAFLHSVHIVEQQRTAAIE
jgi:hypothetical protein